MREDEKYMREDLSTYYKWGFLVPLSNIKFVIIAPTHPLSMYMTLIVFMCKPNIIKKYTFCFSFFGMVIGKQEAVVSSIPFYPSLNVHARKFVYEYESRCNNICVLIGLGLLNH